MLDKLAELIHYTSTLTDGLMPHGICLLLQPELIVGIIIFHALTWLSYMAISFSISEIVNSSAAAHYTVVSSGFQWFVGLCGWTHFAAIIVIFIGGPAYWLLVMILGMTAAISLKVAWYLASHRDDLIAAIGGTNG